MGRFKSLADFEEGLESFSAQYRIPPEVGVRYCKEGQRCAEKAISSWPIANEEEEEEDRGMVELN